MRASKQLLISLLLIAIVVTNLNAQEKDDEQNFKKLAIDLEGGVTYPNMDIDGLVALPLFQGGVRYNLSDMFGLRGEFSMGTIEGGEDQWDREFTNEHMRYGLMGQINLGKMMNFHKSLGGVGLQAKVGASRIHSEITDLSENTTLAEDLQDGNYTDELWAATFGGILQFKLASSVSLNLGVNYHMSTTDLLDGYASNPLANNYDDRYTTATLGVSINLGSGKEHADWVDLTKTDEVRKTSSSNQKSIKELHNKLDDADDDGVINAVDQDNATQEGIRVSTKGVPMDTDYDGMPDYIDRCPVDSGVKANEGCPKSWDSVEKARAQVMRAPTRSSKGQGGEEGKKVDRKKGKSASGEGKRTGDRSGTSGGGSDMQSSDQGQAGASGDRSETGSSNESGSRSGSGSGSSEPKRTYSEEEVKDYEKVPSKSESDPSQAQHHYIIGGSFNSKANAMEYKKYLQSEGFEPEVLFVESDNLFRVAFGKYDTYQAAQNDLDGIRDKFSKSAWIMMY